MKRTVSLLLCIALLFGVFTATAFAQEPYEDSEFFTEGDYIIHYRVVEHSGEFVGRIFMLHGFMCSTFAWRNMAAELSRAGYDCVLADLPNFGYSTRETAETRVIPREELMASLMQSIAPMEEWIIAGHSMGGGVAVNIAENYPVKALLLYCPAPQSEMPQALEGIMTSSAMRGAMNAFFRLGLPITPLVRLVVYAATLDLTFALAYDTDGVTAPLLQNGTGSALCYMMYNVAPTDLANTGKITCPVLICNAEKDLVLRGTMKKDMLDAFPTAQTYVVMGGGHQCIENRAQELSEVTLDFLSQ